MTLFFASFESWVGKLALRRACKRNAFWNYSLRVVEKIMLKIRVADWFGLRNAGLNHEMSNYIFSKICYSASEIVWDPCFKKINESGGNKSLDTILTLPDTVFLTILEKRKITRQNSRNNSLTTVLHFYTYPTPTPDSPYLTTAFKLLLKCFCPSY